MHDERQEVDGKHSQRAGKETIGSCMSDGRKNEKRKEEKEKMGNGGRAGRMRGITFSFHSSQLLT